MLIKLLTHNTFTKVEWNVETIDTDNAFDPSTNYRFTVPSGAAGYYYIEANVSFYDAAAQEHHYVEIRKNGSNVRITTNWYYNCCRRY